MFLYENCRRVSSVSARMDSSMAAHPLRLRTFFDKKRGPRKDERHDHISLDPRARCDSTV